MKFLVCIMLVICGYPAFPQKNIDSLKSNLGGQDQAPFTFSLIAAAYMEKASYDSAIDYYHRSWTSGRKFNHAALEATVLNGLGAAYSGKGNIDSSVWYLKRAALKFEGQRDTTNLTIVESNLSVIYKNRGLYDKALEYAFSALSKMEFRKPDRALASCFNTIALVYANLGEYEKSLEYHYKALKVRSQIGFMRGVGQSHNNIGEAYAALKIYDSAIANFSKAIEIKTEIGEKATATLNNLGEVALAQGDIIKAKMYFNQSLVQRVESGDQLGQALVLSNLAEASLKEDDISAARKYIDRSQLLVGEGGALEQRKKNLQLRVALLEKSGDAKGTVKSLHELLSVKDSLLSKDKAESLTMMQVRYETEEKEQQIRLLEREQEFQRIEHQADSFRIWSAGIMAVLFLIIAVLLFLRVVQARKTKQRDEFHYQEQRHRIKNNLQLLASLLTLQSEHLSDESAIRAVKSSEGRVNAMALIHQKLSSRPEGNEIRLREYMGELIDYLAYSYQGSSSDFKLYVDVADINLNVDKAVPIGLILNELVSNSFKYAFPGHSNPELKVKMLVGADRSLVVNVKDNGGGIRTDWLNSKSFGLKMVVALTNELKAKLQVENNGGADIILTVPMAI